MSFVMDDPALIAQPRACESLQRLIADGRAHALLLTGRAGSGPRSAAVRAAQRVLCPAGGDDGCEACQRVARRVHPDLHWLTPEGGSLAIDQIRGVVDTVSRMPFEAQAQVVVIEHADSLSSDNAAAGNSLLKALEEPAGRVIFVLLAERPGRILPTIRSRAIEVVFGPISDDKLMAALEASGVDRAQVAAATGLDLAGVARLSRGDYERALSVASGGDVSVRRGAILPVLEAVVAGTRVPADLAAAILDRASAASDEATLLATTEFEAMAERMSAADKKTFMAKTNDQGMEKRTNRRARRARVDELQACLDEVALWWRDVLAIANGAPQAVVNVDRSAALNTCAEGPAASRAVAALDAIDEAAARLIINNADEPVTIGALAAELASLASGRIRARRTLGAPARTPAGYDLALG